MAMNTTITGANPAFGSCRSVMEGRYTLRDLSGVWMTMTGDPNRPQAATA
jgi:hypothetical protein